MCGFHYDFKQEKNHILPVNQTGMAIDPPHRETVLDQTYRKCQSRKTEAAEYPHSLCLMAWQDSDPHLRPSVRRDHSNGKPS